MLLDMSLLEATRVDAELIGPCGVDFSVPTRQSEMSIEAMLRRWQQCFQVDECCYELPISVTQRGRGKQRAPLCQTYAKTTAAERECLLLYYLEMLR